jgi:SAM-dependent methyltransferase
MSWLRWVCPSCGAPLEHTDTETLHCAAERCDFRLEDGIWHLLPADREAEFDRFLREYRTIRHGEGRGSDDSAYYRALPFRDLSSRHGHEWRIRARSHRYLLREVISPAAASAGRELSIADLGAGNCWLSNRLALAGHRCLAVDLSTSRSDGLGAHRFYESEFVPVRAEFDRLPFEENQFDVAIFNGSLHYATSYDASLGEALRVLRCDGALVVMESPIYRRAESGRQMVREREQSFEEQYGFPSDALEFENFLTRERFDELADALGIRWAIHRPFYGWRWWLRPWIARLRGSREPADLVFAVARKDPDSLRDRGPSDRSAAS